ncbi:putative chitinase 1 protein [Phaeoacremonium minimum UCRPA7]|uniref:chitinase n=1 Tax=Phaeoacremonium minimum (strain UCR-PA7) TaxID=1286976 RepID=R8BN84_PHAM7|nr:putative chitinase 1 protein [Phaeoacremonium minimum UCRPA7]EOO00806.1 putative chitinase 1 protein [Phaeoacremonium minimum UCRPA7]
MWAARRHGDGSGSYSTEVHHVLDWWPFWADVGKLRQYFTPETKIMVAIGGWGDVAGFERAAKSEESRQTFAASVAKMVETTGADGVDIDWEYPGGNGDDYKKIPNSKRAWEIEAYPLLLAEIRDALGKDRLISAAVPGLERDMMAFTRLTVPRIMRHIDFLNVMTYDLMNRRDNVTKHHTGIENSIEAVDAYVARGAAPQSINLGFAFYTKFIRTEHDDCANAASPLGCKTLLLEDPDTGADLGRTGGFSYHDEVPEEVAESWARAQWAGVYDEEQGGYYYWDPEENLWWTFDTPEAILKKFPAIVEKKRLGGVFAWGLGEDAPGFEHLAAVDEGLTALKIRKGLIRDEL